MENSNSDLRRRKAESCVNLSDMKPLAKTHKESTKPRSQDKIGEERNKHIYVDISGIERPDLLYELWKKAKPVPWLKGTKFVPDCSLEQARSDIESMTRSNSLNIQFYYGKVIHMNLENTIVDIKSYNDYNGKNKAQAVIKILRSREK